MQRHTHEGWSRERVHGGRAIRKLQPRNKEPTPQMKCKLCAETDETGFFQRSYTQTLVADLVSV